MKHKVNLEPNDNTKGVLVITDHQTHEQSESIYPLLTTMITDKRSTFIHVMSRGISENALFFNKKPNFKLHVSQVDEGYKYTDKGNFYQNFFVTIKENYNVIFLRIDRPLSDSFLCFIKKIFNKQLIINDPVGINLTGSKEFLLDVANLCPPMKICYDLSDIEVFRHRFPVVLKPLQGYGGKGIIKIENDTVTVNENNCDYSEFESAYNDLLADGYLAMKFLKRVTEGDKRIIVINGEIIGAILRFPQNKSFLCNLKQGGHSTFTDVDQDEIEIVKQLSPIMDKNHVVIYGLDTLMDDDGHRKLSEINSLNVGGLIQAQQHSGKPVIDIASELIWDYIENNEDIYHTPPKFYDDALAN
jgi:glutathione synthase